MISVVGLEGAEPSCFHLALRLLLGSGGRGGELEKHWEEERAALPRPELKAGQAFKQTLQGVRAEIKECKKLEGTIRLWDLGLRRGSR